MEKQARDIEALLIWAYRDQKAGLMGVDLDRIEAVSAGYEWAEGSGTAAVAEIGRMGCRVQGGGGSWGASADVHHDAEMIHLTVMTLPGKTRHLVMTHAKVGSRPDWYPNARWRFTPLSWRKMKPREVEEFTAQGWPVRDDQMIGEADYDYAVTKKWPVVTPVRQINLPEAVAAARVPYTVWHQTLILLASHFLSNAWMLHSYQALPPSAPAVPWQKVG